VGDPGEQRILGPRRVFRLISSTSRDARRPRQLGVQALIETGEAVAIDNLAASILPKIALIV